MWALLPIHAAESFHQGRAIPCPVSAKELGAVTAIDETIEVPAGAWDRIMGVVTTTDVEDLQIEAPGISRDSVLVAAFHCPARVLLPIQAPLPDVREQLLRLRVTGTKLVADQTRITLLLLPHLEVSHG